MNENDEEWVVWHQGPDDVFDADNMLDAIRKAHEINSAALAPGGYYDAEYRPTMTFGWAVPMRAGELAS